MKKVYFICTRETIYNGHLYRPGQPWLSGDGGSAPGMGGDWTIRQDDETDDPHRGGLGASASRGFVQWVPQPGRPRAALLTPEEKAIWAENPYANLDGPVAAPSPAARDPLAREKKQAVPTISSHLLMTEAERSDPFGLKAKAAAHTAELQAELEKEELPADSPEE